MPPPAPGPVTRVSPTGGASGKRMRATLSHLVQVRE